MNVKQSGENTAKTEWTVKVNGIETRIRIKKMNAIEALAVQSEWMYALENHTGKNYEETYKAMLTRCEAEAEPGKWMPVLQQISGNDVYFPFGIEENVNAVQDCVAGVLNYIDSVFTNSGE